MSNNHWSVKVENISKAYQLGEIGTGTLSRDIERWWAKVRGKEDPFLRIGETNDRTKKGASDIVWSLSDLSFEINQGEAVGIIGRNGAGKSTLLKILSKITAPTSGRAMVRGRVASLLEVGTGFHPELTGRENIFLNGAILGMRKHEIDRNFDAIVDFAGVERYIDTPVKRYSSGMYVRLAFAVAAHLESEVLVVDEVLAVGDAEFQRKCLGKMGEVSAGQGKTVLFVSHNMTSVKSLCNSAILLDRGKLMLAGSVNEVITRYIETGIEKTRFRTWGELNALGNEHVEMRYIKVDPLEGQELNIESGFIVEFSFYNKREGINLSVSLMLYTAENVFLTEVGEVLSTRYDSLIGEYTIRVSFPPYVLNAGMIKMHILFGENQRFLLFRSEEILVFELEETFFKRGANRDVVGGLIRPNYSTEAFFDGKKISA